MGHGTKPHVLILGNRAIARLIAGQFSAEGFVTLLQEEGETPLPPSPDSSSVQELEEVLKKYCADFPLSPKWVHPGTSFWAERPELQILGLQMDLTVVSSPARVLTLFGNKLNLLTEAEKLGIPNLLLTENPMHSLREIEIFIQEKGQRFPFVLKGVKGGGISERLVVHDSTELNSRIALWIEQLRKNTGDAMVVAEGYLEGARHIVLPFARMLNHRFESFATIDASLQCRSRKIVEICPAEWIDPALDRKLRQWAEMITAHCGFVGMGLLEFLVDGTRVYLTNGSARLSASFPLWEKLSGTRAVKWQLATMGKEAPGPSASARAGIAVRIYAEDSLLQLPQPGVIREASESRHWVLPSATAQLSLARESGGEIRPTDSGLVGLLWVYGDNHKHTLTLTRGLLDQIWIAGSLQTNERFVAELLSHPWVREGMFHAGFVDEEFLPAVRPTISQLPLFASVCLDPKEEIPYRWVVGDQWCKTDLESLRWIQGPVEWEVPEGRGVTGVIEIEDGRSQRVCAHPLSKDRWQVRIGAWVLPVRRVAPKSQSAKGSSSKGKKGRLLSLLPGKVHSILFRTGTIVEAHEPLLIVESLGILTPHALPVSVRVLCWRVGAEDSVKAGDELAEFEVLGRN